MISSKEEIINKDIIFNVIDWNDYDAYDDDDPDDSSYVIEAYGNTENNKSVYLKILDYTPYFFVEIPKNWQPSIISRFVNYIKSKMYGKYKNSLIAHDVVKRHKLYGFTAGKRFKFLRLVFNTHDAMKRCSYIFNTKHKISGVDSEFREYKIYEKSIPPLLRFMHIQNINASGKIKMEEGKYTKLPKRGYNTDLAFEAKWSDIIGLEDTTISRIKILSFDLECTSGDGNFPQARRDTDKIIQIGSTFSYNGEEECYFKHIVTLNTCSDIDGVEVEYYEKEKDVLLAWQKLVIKMDPDIITGYNIFGFDNPYLHDRAEFLGIEDKFGIFSRKKDHKCNYVEKNLSSSALGDNKMKYYEAHGRVQIDLMKVIMKDFKLSSYKLDSVAENFLRGKVVKLNGKILEVDKTNDLRIGSYIKLMDKDEELVEDGKKYKIVSIDVNLITLNKSPITKEDKLQWTLSKDDVKPQDIFRLQKGSADDRKIVAEYCIQDCALVNKLMARLCVVNNNIGMSNVCIIPLSYLFLRGQGIKIFSLVAKECRQMNYLIPELKKIEENKENVGYEGATVFNPKIGFYKRPIAVLDYASLYPSSMIQKNLSHETFVDNDKYDNHPEYNYYNCEYNNADGTKTRCRYAKKKDGTLGIMPMILSKLLKQRKAIKKLMGKEENVFLKSIYDGLQLAYKVTANSLYGQLGSSYSQICFKEIAASTTSTGREMLELARDYIENVFPGIIEGLYEAFSDNDEKKIQKLLDEELIKSLHTEEFISNLKNTLLKIMNKCTVSPDTIYGDTDSVFVDFGLKINDKYYENKEALEFAIDLGIIAGNFIKSHLEAPQDLEYEKTYHPFGIMSKKRYVGNKYEFDKNKFKFDCMGIVLKRRDNARIVKKIVGNMIDILLNEVDVDKAVEYVKKSIINVLKGKFPLYYFVTSKTLKTKYADRTRIGHVVLADRMRARDPGSAPEINERVQYVAIEVKNSKKLLQGDKIEHPDYIIENNLKVDYLFYLTNQIKNPTVQFLELLVDDPEQIFNEAIQIETNRRAGNVSIDTFFKVKGKKNQLCNLTVKKNKSLELINIKKSKNVVKYYLNDDNPDMEKLGLNILENSDEEDKNNTSDEEKESENNKKYKKLFLDLNII